MLRRLVKTMTASLLHHTGLYGLAGTVNGREPAVIAYHRVVADIGPDTAHMPSMMVSSQMLERQLDWLARRFRIVSLDELGDRLKNGAGERLAAVTFDDGYRDFYENALPVLKRKGIPAAVFVVTDLVGTEELHLHDRLYLLIRRAFSESRQRFYQLLNSCPSHRLSARHSTNPLEVMRQFFTSLPQRHLSSLVQTLEREIEIENTLKEELLSLNWEMLREIKGHGFTIGSHTCTHTLFTNEDRKTVAEEAMRSRRVLEGQLGLTVRHFAYPDGRFDPAGVEAVAAAGYELAYTCCNHRHPTYPLLTIPRIGFWEESCKNAVGHFSGKIMNCHLSGTFASRHRCRDDHGSSRN